MRDGATHELGYDSLVGRAMAIFVAIMYFENTLNVFLNSMPNGIFIDNESRAKNFVSVDD